MWLRDYHVDGLRLDAVHAFVDTSATHFLEQLSTEVDVLAASLGRHLVLIAESDLNDPRIVRTRDAHGYGIHAQWSDDFHHALHSVVTGEQSGYYEDFGRLSDLATALSEGFVYAGKYSQHRGRPHGRIARDVPGWRFVVAAQNHDQIGNRAAGERLTHLVCRERLQIAAGLLLTAPFVPLLFQGEEWGASTPFQYFTAHEDSALAEQVSRGRRREFAAFGWKAEDVPDPQALETFERSKLRWDEVMHAPHSGLLEWYRGLIRLRRSEPSLLDGNYQDCRVCCNEEERWVTVRRGAILIASNLGDAPRALAVPPNASVVLSSNCAVEMSDGRCQLPPQSIAILRVHD
jgi:maltooligosyltrehalose trehalohydrolase